MDRYEEIKRRLAEGRGVREIARALSCSRRLVREIQRGSKEAPDVPKRQTDPLWMLQIDWPTIIHDLGCEQAPKADQILRGIGVEP